MRTRTLYSLIREIAEIRVLALLAILWFALFFNLEALDAALEPNTTIYVLAILMGIALLSFPNLARLNGLYFGVTALLLYVIISVLAHETDRPLHLMAIELIFLGITILLIRQVGKALLNFEMAYQLFVLDTENSRIIPYTDAKERVTAELERLRHYDRPMSVIYCAAYSPDSGQQFSIRESTLDTSLTDAFQQRHHQIQLGRSIASLTYKSDIVVEYGNGLVIFLPETTQEDSEKFLEQLSAFTKLNLETNMLVGAAYFPRDGVDFDDLLETALGNVHIFFAPETTDNQKIRVGDVLVDLEQRIRIEQQSAWLNKLAYQSPNARAIYLPIKRAMDIAACLAVFPLLLPIMAVIAFLIYLDDGAPIFYMQQRTGYGGRRFKMYKFRTMKVNAPTIPPKVVQLETGEFRYLWPEKVENDPRITRVGRILRKTSLDEIPQLLNVFFGDMSIVGPRPTTWSLEMYTLHQTERLTVKPGITGLWQVSARDANNFDERLLWDVKYVEKTSLLLDLYIIWKTVAQVVHKGGA